MKTLIKLVAALGLALLLCSVTMGSAQTAEYEAKLIPIYRPDSVYVDLLVRSLSTVGMKLGTSTFFFEYNKNAVEYVGKISAYDGPWDDSNPLDLTSYGDMFALKHITEARASYNVERKPSAPDQGGIAIPETFTRVGRIAFKLLDVNAPLNLKWIGSLCAVYDWSGNFDFSDRIQFMVEALPVPVELVSFAAMVNEGAVVLTWKTASETNNLGFTVLRSENEIGPYKQYNGKTISGAGNSEKVNEYSFIDRDVVVGTKYFYKLADIDFNGSMSYHGPASVEVTAPKEYALKQNYPNPFNPETKINFSVKEHGRVRITIMNLNGQEVRTLVDKPYNAGFHLMTWDGRNDQGILLPSGIYFCHLRVNDFNQVIKMQMLK